LFGYIHPLPGRHRPHGPFPDERDARIRQLSVDGGLAVNDFGNGAIYIIASERNRTAQSVLGAFNIGSASANIDL
jgi:hypothetical protein